MPNPNPLVPPNAQNNVLHFSNILSMCYTFCILFQAFQHFLEILESCGQGIYAALHQRVARSNKETVLQTYTYNIQYSSKHHLLINCMYRSSLLYLLFSYYWATCAYSDTLCNVSFCHSMYQPAIDWLLKQTKQLAKSFCENGWHTNITMLLV